MAVLFVRHKVEDFDVWKKGYDEAGDMQKQLGVEAEAVYRHAEDPNMVTVYHKFDSMEAAKAFANHPQLAEVMRELSVLGEPEVWFAHEV